MCHVSKFITWHMYHIKKFPTWHINFQRDIYAICHVRKLNFKFFYPLKNINNMKKIIFLIPNVNFSLLYFRSGNPSKAGPFGSTPAE
jgi:hypothetical protein